MKSLPSKWECWVSHAEFPRHHPFCQHWGQACGAGWGGGGRRWPAVTSSAGAASSPWLVGLPLASTAAHRPRLPPAMAETGAAPAGPSTGQRTGLPAWQCGRRGGAGVEIEGVGPAVPWAAQPAVLCGVDLTTTQRQRCCCRRWLRASAACCPLWDVGGKSTGQYTRPNSVVWPGTCGHLACAHPG